MELVSINDVDSFTENWDNMDPKTGAAVIISHCNGMSLIFEDTSSTNAISAIGMNSKGNTLPSISDLKGPDVALLYLYACNAAHQELLEERGTNVADAFRDLPNVDTVFAYDGSVGFGIPELDENLLFPRLAKDQSGYQAVFSNFNLKNGLHFPSGLQRYDSD